MLTILTLGFLSPNIVTLIEIPSIFVGHSKTKRNLEIVYPTNVMHITNIQHEKIEMMDFRQLFHYHYMLVTAYIPEKIMHLIRNYYIKF